MILRKFHWLLLLSLYLPTTITAQDGNKSYDDSDWIPITPSNPPEKTQKAEGRVLNLDTPNQNFFPENDYSRKSLQPQQYLRETVVPKSPAPTVRHRKPEQPYKFEPVLPLQTPQYIQQNQFIPPPLPPPLSIPYIQPVQQQPVQQQILSQQLVAPPENNQNYYDNSKTQQYDIATNNSYYQPANVASITQELLGAIQHQNINQNVHTIPITTTTLKPKDEKQTVQLLYVPLENLKANQPVTQQASVYRRPEIPQKVKQNPRLQNHRQSQLTNIADDFIRQALAAHKLQEQLQHGQPVLLQTTTTTAAPKKRKPNQPPLSVYMEKQGSADVKDVLDILKHAKSISVQDSVGPQTPQVFVGPSNLDPDGYSKFPLPYLSSVQGNRIERKVEQLPFFVAPLSYKTPDGYSKIPLPSPHVGSVVVSTKEQLHEKHSEVRQPQTAQNQIVQDFDIKQPFSAYPNQPVQPNGYLLTQNPPQANQNSLFGFGGDFLGSFPGNTPQTYQVNEQKRYPNDDYRENTKEESPEEDYEQFPSKNVVPHYQLGSNTQYYDTTPKYKTEDKPNTRGSYQIPDYQIGNRNLPNHNSKEIVQDYDIPSVPVESKTSFTPTYPLEEKPQISQVQSYETPKPQADIYRFNEETIKQTTTTTNRPVQVVTQQQFRLSPTPQNEYSVPEYNSRVTAQVDPFGQVINQYEIEQINSQLGEGKTEAVPVEPIRTTTPAIISTQKYRDYDSTTVRSRTRGRHRGRTTTTTTSTTPNILIDDKYTVLEEFAIQPKTSTVKYTTEVETIPAKVYKLDPEPPQPTYVQEDIPVVQPALVENPQQNQQTFIQNQPTLTPRKQPPASQNQQIFIQNQPSFTQQRQPLFLPEQSPVIQNQPVYVQKQAPIVQNQHLLNQQALDQQILRAEALPKSTTESQEIQDPRLTPIVYNRGQNPQEEEQVSSINPYLPGLINNLQDQNVRPLLVPNLLVPTTEKVATIAPQPITEEVAAVSTTTTTEAPRIETTTQRRNRGRQRAHTSRYSSTSAPRRNVSRRRPNYTRPTTERATTEATVYEPTRRTSGQRQRFRTRGRPAKEQSATERVFQTTESAFKQPQLEGGFQASSGDPQSYMQFDPVINNQQVITLKPEQVNEERPMKEYHQVYSLPSQGPSTERVQEEIITTSKPVVDVKITHPVTERIQPTVVVSTPSNDDDSRYIRINNNIQSGGVYNNRNDDVVTRAPTRGRVRSRTRSRFSSTTPRTTTTYRTTTTTTTVKPQEEGEEQEFYGFIRKPAFNKQAPVYTTTQQPLPLYSASYQESPKTLIQLEDDGAGSVQDHETSSQTQVQYVGQIRPKYTTTEAQEYSTEAPRPRQRARIRVPNRKVTTHQQQSYNEVKPNRYDDQVTRRSSVVRTRSRGKSHFKNPENPNQKKDDHDVEGGNYPAAYLKQLTTEKPSAFQITVDPSEEEVEQEDQVPHSSLYMPQIIRNTDTQWVEASVLPPPNELEFEDKQMFEVSSEEQTTFPSDEIEDEPTETEQPEEEATTVEPMETTTLRKRKVGRRRGVWKLVKHRPIDSFETAESQNYYAVVNGFDQITKKDTKYDYSTEPTTTTSTTTPKPITSSTTRPKSAATTTESSIFEAIYSMLGLASKASQVPENKPKVKIPKEEITTTTASPTFPEEITEEVTTQELKQVEEIREETTTVLPTTTTEATVKNYDVEPWNTHEIRTSTSTEVSHETEICYKGKCIKSKDEDTRL